MKMAMARIVMNSPGYSNAKVQESAIHFDELRQGVHQARCRYDFLPGGGATNPSLNLSRIVNLTITSEASDNAKGRRRVLVKVELPYARFAVLDPSNPSHTDKLPTNFGDVSAHIVLSIPSGMKSDCESTDYVSRASAEASLQLVLGTLLSALGANVGNTRYTLDGVNVTQTPNHSIGASELESTFQSTTPDDTTYTVQETGGDSFKLTLPEPGVQADDVTGLPILTVRSQNRIGDESGISGTSRGILGDAKSPLARGLAGLVPIEENAAIYVPAEFYCTKVQI